jgi:hypothetical protein
MRNPAAGIFKSLGIFNFRLWTAGGLISNVGTWMQRVAQDWLVLTQLTRHDASALGVANQFGPRWALGIGAAAGFAAALVAVFVLSKVNCMFAHAKTQA